MPGCSASLTGAGQLESGSFSPGPLHLGPASELMIAMPLPLASRVLPLAPSASTALPMPPPAASAAAPSPAPVPP